MAQFALDRAALEGQPQPIRKGVEADTDRGGGAPDEAPSAPPTPDEATGVAMRHVLTDAPRPPRRDERYEDAPFLYGKEGGIPDARLTRYLPFFLLSWLDIAQNAIPRVMQPYRM